MRQGSLKILPNSLGGLLLRIDGARCFAVPCARLELHACGALGQQFAAPARLTPEWSCPPRVYGGRSSYTDARGRCGAVRPEQPLSGCGLWRSLRTDQCIRPQ